MIAVVERLFEEALDKVTITSVDLIDYVRAFQAEAHQVILDPQNSGGLMDVCGTGGDGLGTFNISTAVAFVVASAGQPLAKHGNRAVSSRSGSFDVLEALNIPFARTSLEVNRSLKAFDLAFLYAPAFHPSFAELAPLRRALGRRTILNVLGPLLNPAKVEHQLIGVYSIELVRPVAEALKMLGTKSAYVVCGEDGSDEMSLCSATHVAHLDRMGEVRTFVFEPESLGLRRAKLAQLKGGDAQFNTKLMLEIFNGVSGAPRDIVLLNAAAALFICGRARDLQEGLEFSRQAIDSGRTLRLCQSMREL